MGLKFISAKLLPAPEGVVRAEVLYRKNFWSTAKRNAFRRCYLWYWEDDGEPTSWEIEQGIRSLIYRMKLKEAHKEHGAKMEGFNE